MEKAKDKEILVVYVHVGGQSRAMAGKLVDRYHEMITETGSITDNYDVLVLPTHGGDTRAEVLAPPVLVGGGEQILEDIKDRYEKLANAIENLPDSVPYHKE